MLGVVVDDAVIVGENIIAEREAGLVVPMHLSRVYTGFLGRYLWVLTTMAAFAPLLFVVERLAKY
ncbi:MAG: hypothetical protein CM1200mP24_00510 [Gammaproteobacteria bacterium]|nr:MAG: hypothetical protein CM1200mP24_00510 [Gammaproteobacteria bacterium]